MDKPVLVIGGGGHAKVLIDCLLLNKVQVLGIVDAELNKKGQRVFNIPIIGTDELIFDFRPSDISLVNGLGSTKSTAVRREIFDRYKESGYSFASIVHPTAIVASDVVLDEGVQIMAGVIIQPGCCLGNNVIINTKASIDHDCNVGDHVHVAPGTTVSGGVIIGAGSHIGTGTVIIQNVIVGKNSITGAGAIVVNNVPNDVVVAGGPARVITR
jgi:UDP-perosamine 4-acetyltransferase